MNFMQFLRRLARPTALLLALLLSITCLGCTASEVGEALDLAGELAGEVLELLEDTSPEMPTVEITNNDSASDSEDPPAAAIEEDGSYYSRDDVALYIHTYGKLPDNFITKSEAEKLGWEGGSVEKYAEGCAIGGDTFGNREGILPKKSGRTYTECDIDTLGSSSRGAKRIVFSNDGLIYYTDDHYETFTLLYGEE